MKVRKPHVAGTFYAGTRSALIDQIVGCFEHSFGPGKVPKPAEGRPRRIIGIVSPHAGYMYSGPVAANGFARLAADGVPDVFVILGPNHTGIGSGVSMMTEGGWETPLGVATIETNLATRIQKRCNIIDIEENAHASEHSIEVQLPFIQFLYGSSVKFVPICMLMQDLQTSREIAVAIIEETKNMNSLILASSDFTHYEPHGVASRKDKTAIDAIMRLDDAALNELGDSQRVTMCGYGPITASIAAAKKLEGIRPEVLSYKTSGDITGDKSAVVGYASIILTRQ